MPLSSRDIGSERHLQLVYQAVANHHEVPPLSELWHVFTQRTWEKSQRGRGFNPTDDRPDVRAVRLPVDEVAARLTTLGLAFRYDVTQCNLAILAELKKTSPILNVCNACGAVARSGSTYGWCWGPEGTFCPYHRDVELPPRPGNWLDLVNAPAEGTEARDHQAEAFRREAPSEESGPADPEAATQAETANLRPLPPRWAEEDVRFLLARLDAGPILVSDPALGIPTIHDPLLKNARHLGFGVFEAETPEYTVGFEAGGALQRTPSGQGWCYVTVKRGRFPYDTEAVRYTLRTWLGDEPPASRVDTATPCEEDAPDGAMTRAWAEWESLNPPRALTPSEHSARQTRKARQAEASAAGPKRRNLPPDVPGRIEVDLGRSAGWQPAEVVAVRGRNLCYRLADGREGRVPLIGRDIVWRAQDPTPQK